MPEINDGYQWTVSLRRKPARPGTSNPEDPGSETYQIICRICGDDPALDDQQIPAELQKIRGSYTANDGVTAFVRHNDLHNATASSRNGAARLRSRQPDC